MCEFSRTEDDLKEIWLEMFNANIVASCRSEEDKHLAKMSMLLKTVFSTHKGFLMETRRERHALSQALADEKQRTAALEAKLACLSALHGKKDAQRGQVTSEAVESPSNLTVKTSPGATFSVPEGRESGLKRLSAEGVSEQSEEGGTLKKAKVTSPLTTPKKEDGMVLCGVEALPVDMDLGPKTLLNSQNSPSEDIGPKTFFESPVLGPKTFFDSQDSPCKDFGPKTYFESSVNRSSPNPLPDSPTSPDLFSEQRPVLRDLEQSPRSSYSPATPKSPIILTARSRRHLVENQENKSPSLIVSQVVSEVVSNVRSPEKSLHVARPLQFASSPTHKPSPVKPNVRSTKLPSPCSIPRPKEPVKSNALIKPLKFVSSPKNVNITEHNNRPVDRDQSLNFENSRKTKSTKSKTASTYLNGQSKLEFQPADKSVKSTKLKQSKLSLSMFQPKKSTVTPSTHLLDEDEQLLLALEESRKIQKELQSTAPSSSFEMKTVVDPNHTFFQGPLNSSMHIAAHSKVMGDLGISPIKSSVFKDKAATSIIVATAEPEAGPSRPPPAPLTPLEKEYLTSYDRVPEKPKAKVPYAFIAPPERKQAARKQLPGWECYECKMFFDAYGKDMSEEERKKVVDRCSKHRQALPVICGTPPGLWDLNLLQSPLDQTQYGELQLRHRTKPGERLIDKATRVSPTPSCDLGNDL